MTQPPAPILTIQNPPDGDLAADPANPSTATPSRPSSPQGAVPLKTPPLPGAPTTTNPPGSPATTPPTTTPQGQPTNGTGTVPATNSDGHPDPATNTKPKDHANHHGDHDTDTDTSGTPQPSPDALNGLASLAPQLAEPLLSAATALPAAALQGAGSLLPALASAVLPQLAALADQLGTGTPPNSLTSHLNPGGAADLAGPLGSMLGEGPAADQARAKSEALARQTAALHEVDNKLGNVLGLASARTEGDRAKIHAIIDDVETALTSARAQGDTPEAQAAVLGAMHKALNDAGDVVSAAAKAKLTDAQFVRSLIHDYLTTAGPTDDLHAATPGSGAGADAARIAHDALGMKYVWGGGGPLGPTGGGFDCSGLTQWAIARASGGRVILPRTTYAQIHAGTAVPLHALAPGDLVFSNWSGPGVPEHVAIYIGNGHVIEAPTFGVPVRISNVPSGAQARRVL